MPNASGGAGAIGVLCAGAMRETVLALGEAFERATGIAISPEFTRSGVVRDRVRQGASVDVVVTTQAAMDELVWERHVVSDSAAAVARSGIGVAVRRGRPKPDIGSVESFKRVLRDAGSIAYADPATGSPSANYLVGLLDRLGMLAELKPKTRLVGAESGRAVVVCDAVANGEAEIGIQQISEVIAVAGVELAGPLPPDIQHVTVFSAAVTARAPSPRAAQQFVEFMIATAAAPVIRAHGMEPS